MDEFNNTPDVQYVEYGELDDDRDQSSILADQYYQKWNQMTYSELNAEYDMLMDKLNLAPAGEIHKQLREAFMLLDEYKKKRGKEANE